MEKSEQMLRNALRLLHHVYHACEKGNQCISQCVQLRERMDHAVRCKASACDTCAKVQWFLDVHSRYDCFFPWKCKVPGCMAHQRAIQELVQMGIDQDFLQTTFT